MNNPTLEELLRQAAAHVWTGEERRRHVISFAYGNCAIGNPRITREMVEREYDRLFPKESRDPAV